MYVHRALPTVSDAPYLMCEPNEIIERMNASDFSLTLILFFVPTNPIRVVIYDVYNVFYSVNTNSKYNVVAERKQTQWHLLHVHPLKHIEESLRIDTKVPEWHDKKSPHNSIYQVFRFHLCRFPCCKRIHSLIKKNQTQINYKLNSTRRKTLRNKNRYESSGEREGNETRNSDKKLKVAATTCGTVKSVNIT